MSKLRELVEKEIELANLCITACGTDEVSAYVHTRYRDRLKEFLEEDDKENQQFPSMDEFIKWRDKHFQKYLGRWEYINIPERGNWTEREIYEKFKTKTT